MLSIIISSYKSELYSAVSINIEKTVGEEYEIIKIDNPGKMSLSEAYNLGAQQSKFDHLLFLHDDVIFKTKNWDKILCQYLSDSKTGIIGLAGSNYVPKAPSGWFIEKQDPDKTENLTKAIAIDGVFMAISKTHFNEILFNNEVKGYHGYDLDFSLRTAKKYQNYIINDIELDHLSGGKIEKAFLDNNIQIRNSVGSNFQNFKNARLEKLAFLSFLNLYFKYYDLTFRNLLFSLKFMPISNFNLSNLIAFLKNYLKIIRYKKNIGEN